MCCAVCQSCIVITAYLFVTSRSFFRGGTKRNDFRNASLFVQLLFGEERSERGTWLARGKCANVHLFVEVGKPKWDGRYCCRSKYRWSPSVNYRCPNIWAQITSRIPVTGAVFYETDGARPPMNIDKKSVHLIHRARLEKTHTLVVQVCVCVIWHEPLTKAAIKSIYVFSNCFGGHSFFEDPMTSS